MTIIDDVFNQLADMTTLPLPVYHFQFPVDVINCVAVFLNGPGRSPDYFTDSTDVVGAIDYPSIQIQVRHTSPQDAYYYAELIRKWLDEHQVSGYIMNLSTSSQSFDLTSANDLSMAGGPAYRYGFNVDFAQDRSS